MKCFFYVELSEVIPQKLIFGRHAPEKLTFWETVSEEIPKSSFFRRLVAESFLIKDWPPFPVRPAAGDFDHIMMTMTVAMMMMTIVTIYMMVIMISTTTMMSPYLLLHKCTNHLLDVQCRNIVPEGVRFDKRYFLV